MQETLRKSCQLQFIQLRVENGELRVMICMIVNHIDYDILNKVILTFKFQTSTLNFVR